MNRRNGVLRAVVWAAAGCLCLWPLFASAPGDGGTPPVHAVVGHAIKFAVSPPLRDVFPVPPTLAESEEGARENPALPKAMKGAEQNASVGQDPVVQLWKGAQAMPAPIIQWEGVNNINLVYPPDTQGDVGPNHYVQWVNLSLAMWDKSGNPVFGPVDGNTLWQALGGVCYANNDGDPIVLYDRLAERWLISQFALPNYPSGPFYQAIAISTTSDPTGSWYLYCFNINASAMNDYPKFGVWPDGYYMSVNQFYGGTGAGVYVFERSKMLTGDPSASFQYFNVGAVKPEFGGMLPSHYEGTLDMAPAPGTPNYFMEVDDSSWIPSTDALRLWECHIDWTTPGNSTFGLSFDPNQVINTAPWAPLPCVGVTRSCIPQPGTAQGLDSLGDRLMYRLQYRNWGSYEGMVVNHTVDAGGGRAGVRWYELRKSGGAWSIYQQGTYAPADSENRWMGSVAMDHVGNLAAGFSVSSGSVYPSIRYAGRLASDPLGELSQGETSIIAGSGSQTGSAARWGDYSTMSVDPVDDCTFWYTQEYIQTTGTVSWQTRIASFKFPNCSIGPTGTLQGTVTKASDHTAISGAKVTATHDATTIQGTTGGGGGYSLILPVNTYDVTASAFGYMPVSVAGVGVTDGGTTTQDFQLVAAPHFTVTGFMRDANTGWPLYGSIDISATGWAGTTVWTDPMTGAYSVDLVGGATYSFVGHAYMAGYLPETVSVGPLAGNATQDLALQVDNCSAPGYHYPPPLLSESFDSGTLPAGWTLYDHGLGYDWQFNDPHPRGNMTGGTGLFAILDSDNFGCCPDQDAELRTPALDCSALSSVQLTFKSDYYDCCGSSVDVDVSANGAAGPWVNYWHKAGSSDRGPKTYTLDISATAAGRSNVMVRFRYQGSWAWWWEVDDVVVGSADCIQPTGGVIFGYVVDYLLMPLPGVTVSNLTTGQEVLTDPNGFYVIYGEAGLNQFKVHKPTYVTITAAVPVAAGGVNQQDYTLAGAGYFALQGTVTDDTTLWPLYAKIHIVSPGQADKDIWTNPLTGHYGTTIAGGADYTITATAWVPGYDPGAATVLDVEASFTQDFQLSASGDCTAPGYALAGGVAQDFSSSATPGGWTIIDNAGSGWQWEFDNPCGRSNLTGGTGNFAMVDSDCAYLVDVDSELRTPVMNLSSLGAVSLQFKSDYRACCGSMADVDVSANGAAGPWTNVLHMTGSQRGPLTYNIDISAIAAGQPNVMVRFHYYNAYWDYWWEVDDVMIGTPTCTAPSVGGLVMGYVRDANTNAMLPGATVANLDTGETVTAVATPDPNVGDAFYTIYSQGSDTLMATKALYGPDTHAPAVPAGTCVGQDFNLPAGSLYTVPASMTATVVTGDTADQTLTLYNSGGFNAPFTLTESPGHPATPLAAGLNQYDVKGERERVKLELESQEDKGAGRPRPFACARQSLQKGSADLRKNHKRMVARGSSTSAMLGPLNYILDDGTPENSIGLTAGGQFIWLNRFTPNPADFPFQLEEISVLFDSGTGINVGELVDLYVYEDTDGDGNPGTGAVYLGGMNNAAVQFTDGSTFSVYTLPSPVLCSGPGDILIAVVNRTAGVAAGTYVAALDQTSTQSRSWIGLYTSGNPADPPPLPADNLWGIVDGFGFPGNWMIRGSGSPADVPWLSEAPTSGTVGVGGNMPINVHYDATALTPGDYLATINVNTTTPYGTVKVPVTMHVVYTPVVATAATADPTSGLPPLTVNFTGSATGGDGGPYYLDWNYGDGSAHGTGAAVAHTYNVPGDYTVTLAATDNHGGSDADSHITIHVDIPPPVYNMAFMDDAGLSQLCVNMVTGQYMWTVIVPGPTSYERIGQLLNGGSLLISRPGADDYIYFVYDPIKRRAYGYYLTPGGMFSYLNDADVDDDPPCGP